VDEAGHFKFGVTIK